MMNTVRSCIHLTAPWKGVAGLLKFITALLLMLPVAFGQMALTTEQIAKRVSPSVVVIQGKSDSGDTFVGSGFIATSDGKIVTNLHVIRDLKTASIQLANGRTLDSVLVLATDERRDLAIIEISGFDSQKRNGDALDTLLDQLPRRRQVLDLGNSDNVAVGEPVVIVGSPRGLEGTVTAGILSSVRDSGEGFKVLQTDAAVNPGNSGGPLVNNKGQAIGVVSFKLRSAEGLNFAVPINYVRELLNNIHEPMSLAQMRKNLSARSTTNQQSTGPSLKETLDWLRDKIPLAANHYTFAGPDPFGLGRTKDVTIRTVPIRFDSCIVIFDLTEVDVWEKYRDSPMVTTTRYTVPLGAITGGDVMSNTLPLSPSPESKKIETWTVVLDAMSKVVLGETHEDLRETTKSESQKWAFVIFYDESIARRVLEAFKHAADLCREQKEPF